MALIYIIGAPGVGKSAVQQELARRGFETHDVDDRDIGGAHDKNTGEHVPIPPADQRTSDWFDTHEYRIFRASVEALRSKAADRPVFLCGVATNDAELAPLFDDILYLTLHSGTLVHRVTTRTDNDYGHNEFELAEILRRKAELDAKYVALGAVTVNAAAPIERVVDEVLVIAGLQHTK